MDIKYEAQKRGFSDVRFISTSPFYQWEAHVNALQEAGHADFSSMTAYPRDILADAKAIIVLMTAFSPYDENEWPDNCVQIHPHYLTSHRQYMQTIDLIERIKNKGYQAKSASQLPERHAALRAGYGKCGHLGLLIHPKFGSYICFHTIITDMPLKITHDVEGDILDCPGCGSCVSACPTGAVKGDGQIFRENCLRHYAPSARPIPHAIRKKMGMRYIGCDLCQQSCPQNQKLGQISPPDELIAATRLEGLLSYDTPQGRAQVKALRHLIGPNNARPHRVAASAAIHAGNSGDQAYAPLLIHMLGNHTSTVARGHAAWALGRLGRNGNVLKKALSKEIDHAVIAEIHQAIKACS